MLTGTSRWVLVLALTAGVGGGCSSGPNLGFGVAMTLHFDDTVTDDALARITTLSFATSEPFDSKLQVGRPLARVERIVYRPLSQVRSITIQVSALDANGVELAAGVASVATLAPDKTSEVDVSLTAPTLSDGGTPDGNDLGADLTSACSGVTGTIICEDFEHALPSFWAPIDEADIMIDTTRAHTGTHALHVQVPAGTVPADGVGGTIENQNLFDLGSATEVWVTAHYYLTSTLANGSFLFILQQWDMPFDYVTVGAAEGHPQLSSNLVNGAMTSASTQLPTNAWTCVTLHVVMTASGTAQLLIDANDVPDITLSHDFTFSPSFGRLRLGYLIETPATSTSAVELWIDDIRIDTTPFSCAH